MEILRERQAQVFPQRHAAMQYEFDRRRKQNVATFCCAPERFAVLVAPRCKQRGIIAIRSKCCQLGPTASGGVSPNWQ